MNAAPRTLLNDATRRVTDTLIIVAAVLLVWQGLAHWAGPSALAGPMPTLGYLVHFLPSQRFAVNALATAITFGWALLIAYAVGLGLGVWMGGHRLSGAVGEPILVTLYSLPKITLYPVILLIFGLSIGGKITFGAIHGVLPVALMTTAAIRNIPPVYLKAARTLHLSPWQTVTTVLLPATLPEVMAGLRIGFTVTLFGVLLSEMFASRHGLGFLIVNAMALMQIEEMITIAVVLFIFAAVANTMLLWVEHRLHKRG